MLKINPLGYFRCNQVERYMAPRQAELAMVSHGSILLNPDCNFEQALEDLEGFDRIWLVYWFHRNKTWKPKVTTPRGGPKRGVFATRSPHRPNPIGLSCVELLHVEGREIYVGKSDLLDGTPILDIKPYLSYADAFPDSKQGWTEGNIPTMEYNVEWSERARDQADFIEKRVKINLVDTVELRLRDNPFPFPSHRIKKMGDEAYILAVKTWRICYSVKNGQVFIEKITSGYDADTLRGRKESRWDDVPVHVDFLNKY